MKDIIRIGLILLVICSIAAVALGLTNELTYDRIQEQRRMANELAKKEVAPEASEFVDITGADLEQITTQFAPVSEVYIAKDATGEVIGYIFKSAPTGFGGPIQVVTGISMDGTVTGLRVGSHNETPGLGAKATDAAFYDQYVGKTFESPIGVSKTAATGNDIQAITGATISSQAISDGANASVDAFKWILENGGVGN